MRVYTDRFAPSGIFAHFHIFHLRFELLNVIFHYFPEVVLNLQLKILK